MAEKQVVKRNGKTEKFDLGKLKKVMERAMNGFELDLKPLEENSCKSPSFLKSMRNPAKDATAVIVPTVNGSHFSST